MWFMGPRGLKIRIDIPHAFALMARLRPDRTAFDVLKTSEGLEDLPSIISWIICMFAMLLGNPSPGSIVFTIVLSRFVGLVKLWFGFLPIPGTRQFVTQLAYLRGFGLFAVPLAFIAFLEYGWHGIPICFGGWLLAVFISFLFQSLGSLYYYKVSKVAFTQSELVFYHAYRLHADSLDITNDIDATDEELQSGTWVECLLDYAKNYPESVRRFENSFLVALNLARVRGLLPKEYSEVT